MTTRYYRLSVLQVSAQEAAVLSLFHIQADGMYVGVFCPSASGCKSPAIWKNRPRIPVIACPLRIGFHAGSVSVHAWRFSPERIKIQHPFVPAVCEAVNSFASDRAPRINNQRFETPSIKVVPVKQCSLLGKSRFNKSLGYFDIK